MTTNKTIAAIVILAVVALLAWAGLSEPKKDPGQTPPPRTSVTGGGTMDPPPDPPPLDPPDPETTREPEPEPEPEVSEVELPPLPKAEQPEPVPVDQIVAYYPIGKTVRSVADLYAHGTGKNRQWGLQGEAHFVYRARAAVETKVVDRTEDSVTFRQRFHEVSQSRAIFNETLELNLPSSPLLDIAWESLKPALLLHPASRTPFWTKDLISIVDPNLKKSLTAFYKLLRRGGVEIPFEEPVELEIDVDKLTGAEIEFEYVSGLGVTRVKVLTGPKFPQPALELLGYNASLFLDYFIGRAQETAVEEKLTVRSQDIAGIAYFGYDVKVGGELVFRREAVDAPSDDAHPSLKLVPVGGEVSLAGDYGGSQRTVTLKPLAGEVLFAVEDGIVRSARSTWRINQNSFTKDHLLFQTERIRDLHLETRYDAERIDQKTEGGGQGGD